MASDVITNMREHGAPSYQEHLTKEEIKPGEKVRLVTDMFPDEDEFILFSLPLDSQDSVELHPPFSRVDIYISADARIERTTISQNFFARFYQPD